MSSKTPLSYELVVYLIYCLMIICAVIMLTTLVGMVR